ncbi:hypothetical protein BCR34DRAFT_581112 [Clohesyomyces aquaticus]|uniref:Uncharacterized protein n=1 Tax=Clohesyomyces aquaticus TaxID=1231657 RepID=A0A1Y1Y347_9PLEO|nr:hypothetical protein BCR34DRAFT_581112 [Clohesyomyces aquaticus]
MIDATLPAAALAVLVCMFGLAHARLFWRKECQRKRALIFVACPVVCLIAFLGTLAGWHTAVNPPSWVYWLALDWPTINGLTVELYVCWLCFASAHPCHRSHSARWLIGIATVIGLGLQIGSLWDPSEANRWPQALPFFGSLVPHFSMGLIHAFLLYEMRSRHPDSRHWKIWILTGLFTCAIFLNTALLILFWKRPHEHGNPDKRYEPYYSLARAVLECFVVCSFLFVRLRPISLWRLLWKDFTFLWQLIRDRCTSLPHFPHKPTATASLQDVTEKSFDTTKHPSTYTASTHHTPGRDGMDIKDIFEGEEVREIA